jgi:threonylcarbamoyladenosine tRNA methylthiotransferase MtaB
MPQLERELVKSRAARLRNAAAARRARWLESLVGTVQPVLVEGEGVGHTDSFAPIALTAGRRGQTGPARITAADDNRLTAVWA